MPDHTPQFTAEQIGHISQELQNEYREHNNRLRVRRLLVEMAQDAKMDPKTGTYVPEPFTKSDLIIKSLLGDVVDGIQHFTSRIAANDPQVAITPVSIDKRDISKTLEENAAEQERLLMSIWFAAGGKSAQWRVAWSQTWGRVGWYLTLPRDAAWGLPDRTYYDDLTDDVVDQLRRAGKVAPAPLEDSSGKLKHAESGVSWLDRRREAAQQNAIIGRSLMTLEALPPDMVYVRKDGDGIGVQAIKYGLVVKEVPNADFEAGSDLMKRAAAHDSSYDGDLDKYGIYMDDDGNIIGGVTQGGEEGSVRYKGSWGLTIFLTRQEVYYYATRSGPTSTGKIIWHDVHGDGVVPLVPVPAMVTDSWRPGAEYSSPMEGVFALAPLLNQLATLGTNVASWNALGRFVIEKADGTLLRNPETGDPIFTGNEPGIGFDPREVTVTEGKVKQLTIDAGFLMQWMDFYSTKMQQSAPRGITPDAVGAGSPAWSVRQFITEQQADLRQPVDHHAQAVQDVMHIWIGRLRRLDEKIIGFAAPGLRKDAQSRRGLIEFDPKDLTDAIHVSQPSQTAADRIVLDQAGVEKWREGLIDFRQYAEEYALEPDPEQAEARFWIGKVKNFVLLGDPTQILPGSVLFDISNAARGQVFLEMLERSPNFALAEAEKMAGEAQGNAAQQLGLVQPGQGMATTQPSSPGAGAPDVPAQAPAIAR